MTTDGRRPLASGLTLREEFARSAMVGLLSCYADLNFPENMVAAYAIEQADAMISELNKPEPDPEDT